MTRLLTRLLPDDRALGWLFLAALLVYPFFDLADVRVTLGVTTGAAAEPAVLALLCLAAALAWRSLSQRGFQWASPAQLTWSDFGPGGRVRTLGRRMWAAWAARLGGLGYLWGLVALVGGLSVPATLAGTALLLSSAALAAVLVWRLPTELTSAVELALPAVLAALAVLALCGLLTPILLAAVAGAFLTLTGAALIGARRAADRLGRAQLVSRWANRVIRGVATRFLDVLLLLPVGEPVSARLTLRRPVLLRLELVRLLARRRFVLPSLLLAGLVAAGVAWGLSPVWLFGLGGYFAVLPFTGGLGELYRSAGLRRWLGFDRRVIWQTWAGLLTALVTLWTAAALLLVPAALTPALALVIPLVAVSVLRTVARDAASYDTSTATIELGAGPIPVAYLANTFRGLVLLLFGLLLLG
ncbi:hypothetical protein [Crossiella sp. CA198]|uniref:hypothetical protein n=1 Tax=Crossiella sp. CA198 TaxID=3455607 RepID=UPI003F8D7D9D